MESHDLLIEHVKYLEAKLVYFEKRLLVLESQLNARKTTMTPKKRRRRIIPETPPPSITNFIVPDTPAPTPTHTFMINGGGGEVSLCKECKENNPHSNKIVGHTGPHYKFKNKMIK